MIWRVLSFALCQLAGALLGWWIAAESGVVAGLAAGSFAWFWIDFARGVRVLRWLRRADSGNAPSMSGLWGEVSDRARRQLRLREKDTLEQKSRLQEFLAAIQASPNGVVLLDPQGRIEWCNATAAAHFGFDPPRDVLQHIGNLVRDPAFTAYAANGDFAGDVVIPGRDSTAARPVKISAQLHPYGEGRRLLISRDVTALEQADVMRRDFVANVSHEIRTPLTVLAGFVETLQTLSLDAHERARYLELMAQQAHRMQTLVNDLLTLSKLEGSPLPGTGEKVSAHDLLAQCEQDARALSSMLSQPGHQITFDLGPECELAGSPTELLSAMSNLVSNAIRYTPSGGSIAVRWQLLPDDRCEFSVKDTGPGIAPEHLPRLTERFYRVDRSRSRETGGTGLGLAIVKHVMQRHGGELRIASTLGQGSTFALVLPSSRIRPCLPD